MKMGEDLEKQISRAPPNSQNLHEIDLDADEDMFSRKFERGQFIDFINQGVSFKGVIQIVLEEMVYVTAVPTPQNEQLQPTVVNLWIELESDKIAPENTITGNDREHLHKFLKDLSSFLVPVQHNK